MIELQCSLLHLGGGRLAILLMSTGICIHEEFDELQGVLLLVQTDISYVLCLAVSLLFECAGLPVLSLLLLLTCRK